MIPRYLQKRKRKQYNDLSAECQTLTLIIESFSQMVVRLGGIQIAPFVRAKKNGEVSLSASYRDSDQLAGFIITILPSFTGAIVPCLSTYSANASLRKDLVTIILSISRNMVNLSPPPVRKSLAVSV